MRILRIANIRRDEIGGMSRVMNETGKILTDLGHEVDYLTTDNLSSKFKLFNHRLLIPLKVAIKICQHLRTGKNYDVVEIHEPLAAPSCFLKKVFTNLPPIVIFSHGLEECNQLAEKAYCKSKNLPITFTLRFFRITVFQAKYSLHNCDQIVCLNTEDINFLINNGIPNTHISLVSNGVSSNFLSAFQDKKLDPDKRILFVGSWILRKGILDLISVFEEILNCYPSCHFTIAGCNLDIETVISQFNSTIRTRIQVIPFISNDVELIELYQNHSILVLPSYFEGQPLVMLEAAALGLAIVTTNIKGMADFIEDGVNGYTVPVGDKDLFKEKLEQLICDPELIKVLGITAQKKVKKYTWNRSTEMLLLAYKKAIANANHL